MDKPWEEKVHKSNSKTQVPVVPIYFHAKIVDYFIYFLKVSGTFRTTKLPSEVFSQKKHCD
jgi:hypothetical protein